jgi:hypothetical protein
MSYTPQQRAKFVLWFAGCNDDFAAFGVKVRREMGENYRLIIF